MKNLKLLHIWVYGECDDEVSEHQLPSSLRFLRWWGFPFPSLPNTLQHLVGLEFYRSKIVQLWEDGQGKVLYNLRFLKITQSKLRTFDLGLAPNLERLTISYCHNFVELRIPADHHSKLQHLDLSFNDKLKTIHLRNTPNLKTLLLNACADLVEFQMPAESLKLEHLDLSYNPWLTNLHLGNTPNLKTLILLYCVNLVLLPELGRVKCLKELNIRRTGIRHLPQSILQLKGLRISGSTEIFESHGLTYKIQTEYKGEPFEETFAVYES